MYIDVDARALRRGVFRLQGILDWYAGQEWAAPSLMYLGRRSRVRPSVSVVQASSGPEAAPGHGATGGSGHGAASSAHGNAAAHGAGSGHGATPAPHSAGPGQGSAPGQGSRPSPKPRAPKKKEPLDEVQTVFLYFIEHGVLPVAHDKYTLDMIQHRLLEQLQKDPHFFGAPSGGSVFSYELLDILLNNRSALPRLLSQFGEAPLEDLYAHTMESGIVSRWTSWLSDVPGLEIRTLRWKTLLLSLSHTGGRISLDSYSKVEKGIVLYLLREMQPAQLFRWVGQLPPPKLEKLMVTLDIRLGAGADLSELLASIQEQTSYLVPPSPKTPIEETGVYVDNAGLVLLYPFLQTLFQELGWVDAMGFVQENFHQRAVLLTQYLVHTADVFPEYTLYLNKLLCGYPLDATLPLGPDEDSKREHERATQLLYTVLSQWTLNGQPVNAHVNGLRNSWLRRRGKLFRRENDWVLQVEQRAFDVILNSLSWNTRMIQLPWMREVLWVEWG
ncbi:contractile injection system tape measure protein [Dinghuibacter silviterrae]|uniref:Uncharacterized protein n=1 Tax=Dinghuibacter silviterrae TaxID=1539049 RepID=A0A4R8DTA9_9BACT|nr:contractile injection system tape measure protein [Dinghuibacter silviterrae]TDX01510.1 hypothetical protein EDB95_2548 [Dinghuibacter silviterrae]